MRCPSTRCTLRIAEESERSVHSRTHPNIHGFGAVREGAPHQIGVIIARYLGGNIARVPRGDAAQRIRCGERRQVCRLRRPPVRRAYPGKTDDDGCQDQQGGDNAYRKYGAAPLLRVFGRLRPISRLASQFGERRHACIPDETGRNHVYSPPAVVALSELPSTRAVAVACSFQPVTDPITPGAARST